MTAYSLRFIAGVHRGLLVPLANDAVVTLGRASTATVVLAEDAVSRQHCQIRGSSGAFTLEDLGSTNGTFVNGQKVTGAVPLSVDDRLLVGTSVLQVVDAAELSAPAPSATSGSAPPRREGSEALSGRLDKMSLPDVLQLLVASKKSGELHLELPGEPPLVGVLTVQHGHLTHTSVAAYPKWSAKKALARLSREAASGHFRFKAEPAPAEVPDVAAVAVQMMAANDDNDRVIALGHDALGPDSRLMAPRPMSASLRNLSAAQLDLWQQAVDQTVGELLDGCANPDGEVLGQLKSLLDEGYLKG